jgi:NAD-dependent SIR2 family protein deacetylase
MGRGRKKKIDKAAKASARALHPPSLQTLHDLPQYFTKEDFIEGMKTKKYKHIAFLVGAGISVAAGIPDFRSPKSGLYSQVREMGLPCPEDIFSLDYLQDDPQPFFTVAKKLLHQAKPVHAHRFIRAICDRKCLKMVYTQNIDGLELDCGIPSKKILQVHGHMRSAHCIKCKRNYSMEDFSTYAQREEVMHCSNCNDIVKPDIIFFGEKVPRSFHTQLSKITEADLVIVMGTSLQVKPFSDLLTHIPPTAPVVLINRDLPKATTFCAQHQRMLFLQGDIEDVVQELATNLGWDISALKNESNTEPDNSSFVDFNNDDTENAVLEEASAPPG